MKEIEILKKPLFWLVLILILVWAAVFSLPDNRLHLVFCDVGQGDAILVSYRQTQVLIDGGPDNRVLSCLSKHLPFWDRRLEMVILTHSEEDHFGGLVDVIKRYNVSYFVINSIDSLKKKSTGLEAFYQLVLDKKSPIYSPKEGEEIKIGTFEFLVLWPRENFYATELNESSIVLKLNFGYFSALLPGDFPGKLENQLDLMPVDLLKVAHHGSKYSTSEEFLEKINPKLAVISVGPNKFGHPTNEVLERLSNLAIEVLRTDKVGEIEIVSDGRGWYTKVHGPRANSKRLRQDLSKIKN
jgi:competence protein ComEC